VLVVSQSNAALRGLVGELRADFDVHTASRWEEALALIDVRPYEAVVVDVAPNDQNTERDGVGILRAAHARYKEMARVALIAHEQDELGHLLATSGAAEVVMKRPWPEGALSQKLHAIVG
jgi:DNA-binding NtrC family response regulator